MQKKLLAVAVLSAFSGVAAAQSANVTLYGTIVQNVEQVSATGGDGSTVTTGSSARNSSASLGVGGTRAQAAVGGVATANLAGSADQDSRIRFNPAGSNFGIRGTEDLGNGLSAWFQAELSLNFGANPPLGGSNEGRAPTARNTAVGLRSNTWGTALFGVWDTPFNAMNGNLNANSRIAGASTSHNANLLGGNVFAQGAVSGQATASWCTNTAVAISSGAAPAGTPGPVSVGASVGGLGPTAAGCANFGMNFDRRERSTLQWWSPNWNGFEVKAAYNAPQDNGTVTVNNQIAGRNALKQNIWDLALSYSNGPLYVGYAYERQNDTLATAARTYTGINGGIGSGEGGGVGGVSGAWSLGSAQNAGGVAQNATGGIASTGASYMSGSKATGHRLGARYTFAGVGPGSLGLGAMWESLKWDMTYGVDTVAGQVANPAATAAQLLSGLKKTAWRLQGNYVWGSHFIGLDYVRANAMSGGIVSATAAAANNFDGSGTAARAWMLNYNYMLSKRTSIGAYYNTVKNDTNANYSGIVFGGIATAPGASPKYLGMQVRHSF